MNVLIIQAVTTREREFLIPRDASCEERPHASKAPRRLPEQPDPGFRDALRLLQRHRRAAARGRPASLATRTSRTAPPPPTPLPRSSSRRWGQQATQEGGGGVVASV